MRLLSYSIDGDHGFGLLTADRAGVIVSDAASTLRTSARCWWARVSMQPVRSLTSPPITRWPTSSSSAPLPGKIFCIGVNYGGRAQEYDDPADAAYPSVFVRFPRLTGHEQPVIRPPESEQLDYEGEIVVVIGRHPDGKAGRRIPVADARSHIAG